MNETNPEVVARDVVARLERAWNEADATAFGAPFAEDADFVDIRGDHHRSRNAIAAGHRAILDSIYKGSRIRYELKQARELAKDVIVAHVDAELDTPSGPLAGKAKAIPSMVLVRGDNGWEIASFHNTMVAG
jgi:uncharacterized protein (TIGR02246 family)